jgi:short-subunit dehydrogenase
MGASSGIGEALVKKLSLEGANVILSSRSEDKLQSICKNLKHGNNQVVACDISNVSSLEQAISKITESYDNIDVAIFLAAIYEPGSVFDIKPEKAFDIININLYGAFNFVISLLPIFKKQNSGMLALCGSVSGYRGLPNSQPYSATKAGIINLAQSLKTEIGDIVDIKLINPGFVSTPMTDKNEFDMPMIISAEQAAEEIVKGLNSNKFEIHFPKKFSVFMKFLSLLPHRLYFFVIRRLVLKR